MFSRSGRRHAWISFSDQKPQETWDDSRLTSTSSGADLLLDFGFLKPTDKCSGTQFAEGWHTPWTSC